MVHFGRVIRHARSAVSARGRAIHRCGVALVAAVVAAGSLWAGSCDRGPVDRPDGEVTLSIAVASSVRASMEELAAVYAAEHRAVHVNVTPGASGTLYSQITSDAPFDAFFSADVDFPRRLAEAGLTLDPAPKVYAIGALVLWTSRGSGIDPVTDGLDVLKNAQVRKIAIANPEHAPYGAAAVAALKSLGLYESVAERLVLGANVEQTAQFAQSGGAEVAIIPMCLAAGRNLKDAGVYWPLPAGSYEPVRHACVVLRTSDHPDSAREFEAFVLGQRGRAILGRHGFRAPAE